jgi:hypothetical protein
VLGDAHWRHELDVHDMLVDRLLGKYGGRRAKHTGDGVFALFEGPTKAARCGLDLVPALASRGIRIRVGIHTGECERRGEEWSGLAVHVGARIGAIAGPDEVLTSRTVRDLSAGSGLRFESLGAHRLKGLPEETEVFPTGLCALNRGRPSRAAVSRCPPWSSVSPTRLAPPFKYPCAVEYRTTDCDWLRVRQCQRHPRAVILRGAQSARKETACEQGRKDWRSPPHLRSPAPYHRCFAPTGSRTRYKAAIGHV